MRRHGWLELSAWIAGGTLCVLYGGLRLGLEAARAHGVETALLAHASSGSASITDPTLAPPAREVDQALWSAARIRAFAESVANPASAQSTARGVLRIPSVDLEVPIFAGTSEINLNRGAAHIEGTAALSSPGNVGIAGHRDGFFRKLKDVAVGGRIDVLANGRTSRYRISEIRIVEPSDVHVLDPTPVPSVTLVTCYPFYFVGSAPLRYIVRAELMPGVSAWPEGERAR